ncbi:MAG: transposase [Proteobacteria bacterium]|nr:transposase [Pseudomonadota bacterium]
MVRAYGIELRERVVGAIEGGMTARAAAARFSVAPSSAVKWHQQWRSEGSLEPARQGHPPGSKLDTHEAFILGLVLVDKDIALHEIAGRLLSEREVRACPATVWHFFAKRGLTHKKRQGTRPSKSVRTSKLDARTGLKVSSTSTRNG